MQRTPLLPAADVLDLIDAGARWQYRLLRLVALPAVRLLVRIDIVGIENIPRHRVYVVAANHLNWLDAPAPLIAFPLVPRLNFVADATFVTGSRFKWFTVRVAGGVLPLVWHGHGLASALELIKACLARGGTVGFFPEGGYEPDEGTLLPFHHGFARAAIEGRVPIVPVCLSGMKDLWLRKRVCVTIGEPLSPDGHTPDTLASATRERIAGLRPASGPLPAGPRPFRRFLSRLFS